MGGCTNICKTTAKEHQRNDYSIFHIIPCSPLATAAHSHHTYQPIRPIHTSYSLRIAPMFGTATHAVAWLWLRSPLAAKQGHQGGFTTAVPTNGDLPRFRQGGPARRPFRSTNEI